MDELKEITSVIETLRDKVLKCLKSLKDNIDLGTASGRLIANVLASMAAYETELRGERVMAGQAAAKASGKTWGGSEKGRLCGITKEQAATILRLHGEGEKITRIARSVNVSRSSVYRVIGYHDQGLLKIA